MVASSRLTFCIVSPVRLITLTSSTMSYWCTAGGRGRGRGLKAATDAACTWQGRAVGPPSEPL